MDAVRLPKSPILTVSTARCPGLSFDGLCVYFFCCRGAHEATMGGLRLGSFVAVFSAIQLGLEVERGQRDMWNVAAAGAVTTGITGLASEWGTHLVVCVLTAMAPEFPSNQESDAHR